MSMGNERNKWKRRGGEMRRGKWRGTRSIRLPLNVRTLEWVWIQNFIGMRATSKQNATRLNPLHKLISCFERKSRFPEMLRCSFHTRTKFAICLHQPKMEKSVKLPWLPWTGPLTTVSNVDYSVDMSHLRDVYAAHPPKKCKSMCGVTFRTVAKRFLGRHAVHQRMLGSRRKGGIHTALNSGLVAEMARFMPALSACSSL